jgi:hypothetical protein
MQSSWRACSEAKQFTFGPSIIGYQLTESSHASLCERAAAVSYEKFCHPQDGGRTGADVLEGVWL